MTPALATRRSACYAPRAVSSLPIQREDTPAPGQADRKARALAALNAHPFVAPAWLRNPHVQTMWAPLFRRRAHVRRRAERIETPDGDFLDLYIVDGQPGKPAALLLHGLEGSVESKYILGTMEKLNALGWTVVAMEFRGCGRDMNRARRLYHSGETTDLALVAKRVASSYPSVYVAGFSLGGNVLAKWLGESSRDVPANIRAAAVVSVPFDLLVSGPHIERVLGGFYSRHFLRSLVKKAIAKEKQYPNCIDLERVRAARTLSEFDNVGTAPLHGFRDANHYYETQRSGQYLKGVRVPTLLLSAADDPFNPASTLPHDAADLSDYLHPLFTERGGHVGFVYGRPGRPRYWAEEQIVRFFQLYNDGD